MFYLIEPYNAYQQPPRKKHWMEIAEEERLFMQMLEEQKRLQQSKIQEVKQPVKESKEANENPFSKDAKTFLLNKDDGDLPQHAATIGTGVGPSGNADYAFFNPNITLNFTSSVRSGHVPFKVNFINLESGSIRFINYTWNFGDGTATSNQTNPQHNYTTTGSFDVSLTGSAQSNPTVVSFLRLTAYISAST